MSVNGLRRIIYPLMPGIEHFYLIQRAFIRAYDEAKNDEQRKEASDYYDAVAIDYEHMGYAKGMQI